MKNALVVYRSHTGTTRQLAEEIAGFLRSRDIDAQAVSIADCDVGALDSVDYLLLGCWTNGLFVVRQHPDEPWVAFARDVPRLSRPRIGLFTTYTLATGSMFARMRDRLAGKVSRFDLELKSRSGHLSEANKRALEAFITAA